MKNLLACAYLALFSFLFASTLVHGQSDNGLGKLPLVFSEDFESGPSRWRPTDPAAWKIETQNGNRVFSLFKASQYEPPVRSPLNIALAQDVCVSDFVLEAKLKSTTRDYNHRDLCLIFGWQDPSHFYYVHIAKAADPHANSIFIVNGEPRVSIAKERTEGTDWKNDYFHTVRITRDTRAGLIRVYFDDLTSPIMIAEDKTFPNGAIGLGAFDDTGQFDDVKVWGNKCQ